MLKILITAILSVTYFYLWGMDWKDIVGQENLKKQLQESIKNQRVSHAQMFCGEEGYGVLALALAYAKEIFLQENPSSASKIDHLNHVDLHFSFPVFTEKNVSLSKNFYDDFRSMILENPYSNYKDWVEILDSANKQLFISAQEIDQQNKDFSLKSFEGGSKILIVWRADKMNESASNKFLKFLEEPPKNTILILCVNNLEDMLPTIISRCQITEIPRIDDADLEAYLKSNIQLTEEQQQQILYEAQGNFNALSKILKSGQSDEEFETYFIQWVREAFQVKKNPQLLRNILAWAKSISEWNRDKQQSFLAYCTEIFRLALLQNYNNSNLVYKKLGQNNFNWEAFSKFISGANIEKILEELSEADYHVERNGNGKIIWTDLGIKLSRYIHMV